LDAPVVSLVNSSRVPKMGDANEILTFKDKGQFDAFAPI